MHFANIDTVKKIVSDLYPKSKDITFIEHGYDNIVALVDKIYALRFPRGEGAYARGLYEKEVLIALKFGQLCRN